jgi:glycosyltransferase involved in cell wall biosynthesis
LKNNIELSAMFPCYNDSGTIINLIRDISFELDKYLKNYEVIVVDDHSTDNSRELLLKEKESNNRLVLVFHEKNKGYGQTILDGMNAAKFDYFFYTDGDGQYSVKDIGGLIEKIEKETVLVNGYKITRNDPLYRIIIGRLYNLFMKFFFGIKLKDIDCDFRIIKKSVFSNERFYSKSGTICVEMVKRIEMKTRNIKESPVHHFERQFGTSQFFNLRRLFFVFFHVIKLWYILILRRK